MRVQTILTNEQRDLLMNGCDPDCMIHGQYFVASYDPRRGCYVIYNGWGDEPGDEDLYDNESEFVEGMSFIKPLDQWDWEGC